MSESRDGIDHIHIHLHGKTLLGIKLSEFTIRPFRVPKYGEFTHLLGYILYLKTGMKHSIFRHATPSKCLKDIQQIQSEWNPEYYEELCIGVRASLNVDASLVEMLKESTLPLLMYVNEPGDLTQDRTELADIYSQLRDDLNA